MAGEPWSVGYFTAMLVMWIIMMVGMMVPSAIPMVLIYASIVRKAAREGSSLAATEVFVAGYVIIWSLFALVATIAQWALDRMALLSPMMMSNSTHSRWTALTSRGSYQLTPFKGACLRHCRSPIQFLASRWKPGGVGAFQMGIEHGSSSPVGHPPTGREFAAANSTTCALTTLNVGTCSAATSEIISRASWREKSRDYVRAKQPC